MNKSAVPELYKKYFIEKSDERRMLFEELVNLFQPGNGIYPGSFVHITPSFFINNMTYIDSDRRILKFFKAEDLFSFIVENKTYDDQPNYKGYQADYSSELPIEPASFDIMFSFYAGFISQSCKKYLKHKGILVCNNSHGDASIAFTDVDYSLIGVIKRNGDRFRLTDTELDSYFIKKDASPIDREKVLKRMIGENFTKKAYAYIFRYSRTVKNIDS